MEDDTVGVCTPVDSCCSSPTQVGTEPTNGVGIHEAHMDAAEEGGDVDDVEGLGKVHCHRHR